MDQYEIKRDRFMLAATKFILSKNYGPGPHPGTGTPQDVHAGGNSSYDSTPRWIPTFDGWGETRTLPGMDQDNEAFWNDWLTKPEGLIAQDGNPLPEVGMTVLSLAAATLVGRGAARNYRNLSDQMRNLNAHYSLPLRQAHHGAIMDFDVSRLDVMTDGYGFRLGNKNHVDTLAVNMSQGADLFTHGGKKNPIMVLAFDDGAQVLDGKHRLAAARKIGRPTVPVQVARVEGPMPKPNSIRGHWDELRRAQLRNKRFRTANPKADLSQLTPRTPTAPTRKFNDWMTRVSAAKDEDIFEMLGITRGIDPMWLSR